MNPGAIQIAFTAFERKHLTLKRKQPGRPA